MSSVITVENLSKKYIIGHQKQERYTALRDVLANGAKRFTRKLIHPFSAPENDPTHEEFWALKDVSFDIQQGDRVGIIGRNGAGKSTLLKILSRITEPTSGKVSIKGRVASLLEVGTGFHPELTGRENIFLNGAILGMSKAEIKKKFDEIVAFAEVEKFLDTPVKHYSSGMYVRLAFAVAAHLESEILIVDEVLAVGDASFQKKCLGKMEEVGKDGRTVLFVSHNMAMISNLCQKGIVLKQGRLLFQGGMSEAVLAYYQDNRNGEGSYNQPGSKYESENAKLLSAELVRSGKSDEITIHDNVLIRMQYRLKKAVDGKCVPNFHVYRADGVCVFVVSPENISALPPGDYCADCKIPGDFLNEGAYFVGVALTSNMQSHYVDDYYDPNALMFNVVDPMTEGSSRYGYAGPIPGVIRPRLIWDVRKV
jgi:lipopolysaccharide transport system ATP-binding protein